MCGGERPIGAAKGKQSDTEALCQTPPAGVESHSPARRSPACVFASFSVLSCVLPTTPPKLG